MNSSVNTPKRLAGILPKPKNSATCRFTDRCR
jgi:hypothetical protein